MKASAMKITNDTVLVRQSCPTVILTKATIKMAKDTARAHTSSHWFLFRQQL